MWNLVVTPNVIPDIQEMTYKSVVVKIRGYECFCSVNFADISSEGNSVRSESQKNSNLKLHVSIGPQRVSEYVIARRRCHAAEIAKPNRRCNK